MPRLLKVSSSNMLQMRCLIETCISKYSALAAFQCTVVDKNIYTDMDPNESLF